jgi:hypothetical protein
MKTYEPREEDEISDGDNRWISFVEDQTMRSHEIYRDVGKTLLQVMIVLIPGYAAVAAALFTNVPGGISAFNYAPLVAWAATFVAALVVIYPPLVRYRAGDVDRFKQRFTRFIRVKQWAFLVACATLIIGMTLFLVGLRGAVV